MRLCITVSVFFTLHLIALTVDGFNLNFWSRKKTRLSPIILIPGIGGSRLHSVLHRSNRPHQLCSRNSDGAALWPSLKFLIPGLVKCWIDNIRLSFDRITRRSSDTPGVQVVVPGFGEPEVLEYLTKFKLKQAEYFGSIVKAAVGWGYRRGHSIRSAPYDFRKAPNEQEDYFARLKALIEDSYFENDQVRVSVIAHSLGNLMFLSFLHHQPQWWKDRFLENYFAVAAPFGGSVAALKAIVSGDKFGMPTAGVTANDIRTAERTWPALYFMLPSRFGFNETFPVVARPDRNYTLSDYKELFSDIGFEDGLQLLEHAHGILDVTQPPGVKAHCIVGTNVPTAVGLDYRATQFPDGQPQNIFGEGDGTVHHNSARICEQWNGKQQEPVSYGEYLHAKHAEILQNSEFIDFVRKVLVGP